MSVTPDRKRGERRIIDPSMSLHRLGSLCQLRYMEQQGQDVLTHLDALIENTSKVAPVRLTSPYPLVRTDTAKCESDEHRLERAIWAQYGREWKPGLPEFLAGVCPFIQTFQVMLRHTNADAGWGEVDLLGVTPTRLPAVIELKDSDANDTPLRFLVEAVSYGIAIRKAWAAPEGFLRAPVGEPHAGTVRPGVQPARHFAGMPARLRGSGGVLGPRAGTRGEERRGLGGGVGSVEEARAGTPEPALSGFIRQPVELGGRRPEVAAERGGIDLHALTRGVAESDIVEGTEDRVAAGVWHETLGKEAICYQTRRQE